MTPRWCDRPSRRRSRGAPLCRRQLRKLVWDAASVAPMVMGSLAEE